MKTTIADFKRSLKAIRRQARNGQVDRALVELQRMLKVWPDHPRLLLEKSRLIQLSEEGSLADAKRAIKRAVAFEEDSPTPWIELGYYLLVIDDQAEKAEAEFDNAIELGLRQLIEAVTGKIYAILDQDDPLPARKLANARDLVRLGQILAERYARSDSPEIERLRERISEFHDRVADASKSGRNGRNGSRSEH